MPREDKSKTISSDKRAAEKRQTKLKSAGASKRVAEDKAWDEANKKGRGTKGAGTASGRSKVSKRTTKPKGSTRKGKTTGKTRK